ncbi:hypothetical protein ACODT5_09615 [Streptomyces sp. 5.8]|uniref:hypothetical protein n=1 Tax=Streptomyces sp. 5.8 TaxID=3406571 RepID=UPI003BB75B36
MSISTGTNKVGIVDAIATNALVALRKKVVLPGLMYRDVTGDFMAGCGSTVDVRVPSILKAKSLERGKKATWTNLDEKLIPVIIDKHLYEGVKTDSWDATLDIESYSVQVIKPALDAVTDGMEDYAAALIQKVIDSDGTVKDGQGQTVPKAVELKKEADADSLRTALTAVAKTMTDNKVGLTGRVLVIDSEFMQLLQNTNEFVLADQSGSSVILSDGAVGPADNHVGRFLGFDIYLSTYVEGACAFTKESLALVNSVPQAREAEVGKRVAEDGYVMRYSVSWVHDEFSNVDSIDTFAGGAILDATRSVGIKFAEDTPGRKQ